MVDIILEIVRAVIVALICYRLIASGQRDTPIIHDGWNYIRYGFFFLLFGMLIDITDNFESLNRFVVIGDTDVQAFLEKVVGYLLGFILIAIGFWKWLPAIKKLDQTHAWLYNSLKTIKQEALERSKVEKNLEKSEHLVRTIVNTIPDLVWLKDLNGAYLFCNKRVEFFLNAKERELFGKTDFEIFDEETARIFRRRDQKTIDLGGPYVFEEKVKCRTDGHIAYLETVKIPMEDANGKVMGTLGIARDISQRKQMEEERIQHQKLIGEQKKLALIGQVAGKMAHDFNNVLGIIMGSSELALMNCKHAEIKETLDLILEQTIRGKNITRNLAAFAKSKEPKQEFFKIDEKIEFVLGVLNEEIVNIKVTLQHDSDQTEILADPGMIEHALVNMIQNAVHATSKTQAPRIDIRTYQKDGNMAVEIKDNGCGIPEEYLAEIYSPSFSLKGSRDITASYERGLKGTGYGLANVKKYIDQHKGEIRVASTVDKGSIFTICLPIIKRELSEKEVKEILVEKIEKEKSILLVEDEVLISNLQSKMLTQEPFNHHVDVAPDGKTALKLFAKASYDLVSLDYILKGMMNGMDVYKEIRKINPTIRILFVSGNIEFLECIKALKLDDNNIDHLSKPYQNKEYLDSVHRLMARNK